MSGSTDVAIAEAEAGAHARRVGLDRRVDELADVGELDDARRAARAIVAVLDAEEGAGQQDVLAAGQLLVEAGAQGQQARDLAVHVDDALGRRDDPGQDLEQGALAGPVRAR